MVSYRQPFREMRLLYPIWVSCTSTAWGWSKNYLEALKWYRMAADQGNTLGQNNLGVMYEHGLGVDKNYVEALKWYRKAADQGYPLAQSNLGFLYQHGLGVEKNYLEALKWYRLAADQGNAQDSTIWALCTKTAMEWRRTTWKP